MIDDQDAERIANAAASGVMNAIGGIAVLFLFIIHPIFSLIVAILWFTAAGLSERSRRLKPVTPTERLKEAYRATGREPPSSAPAPREAPVWFRVGLKIYLGIFALLLALAVVAPRAP
jgi:hypothetical protein